MQLVSQTEVTELPTGSIITPKGFTAAGVHAGLRYSKKDLGIILSDTPAQCAAVYTTSHFQAAPLKVTQESIAAEGLIQAVIVNSACANACTGDQGLKDAYQMRKSAADKFNLKEQHVAVASTGVIGEYMQMDKIEEGIKMLKPGNEALHSEDFQTAILTTDLVMKKCCYSAVIDGKTVTMGGSAKGSGMIHPNMATMLAFITTDANIDCGDLQFALKQVTDRTFNQITVDGDTSTNDMVLVMANGTSGINKLSPNHPDWDVFIQMLSQTSESLAKQIAKDGEGATKLIEVEVSGTKSDDDARMIAKQIVGSNLVKTAIYGADANWGRIIGAIGQSQPAIDPSSVDIAIGPIVMLKNSVPLAFSEEEAKEYLSNAAIQITVNLHQGAGKGKAWGCDLSYDYVKINASYRT
ncbi:MULTISPECIES: bifunctional ornithine acetyltransferase/N-acetylglutamate synthase [Cytobacillus]|jgi:glutamate N-acetyltransferase/amino-acid N-acetyltransferase|uniref:Arginine biosynthesis bifunctional protein ArgJ n=2 Tax=Cytobacillus TaxID=2675230 RepID=A0ABX3CRA4_9BACI|nr:MULTISPECIES: bifunctional ornithine acetyltransferase/N-acetylglutamate synthase [Cytobacillus]MBY0157022.1 bifunctional ornithine acetyltransferase/N-acetylglutamate synthase [Cytobacillus firmus]MBU8731957.1 bifunctional ornithine acetyltransferase/N-acetylglutamate synthase [Cytobacillus oceanisediminis]MCM3241403.1 bifunctional ornithine acetyltransferase/N-acetylglutamate synthase [Cytobacillus oceanisediminis]MCM3392054.1 bifunctional ornithine acetyltransferase/N-acetylglutamate synt